MESKEKLRCSIEAVRGEMNSEKELLKRDVQSIRGAIQRLNEQVDLIVNEMGFEFVYQDAIPHKWGIKKK